MANGIKRTLKWFKEQSTLKHGNRFDYSLVEYKNAHTKVKIICPIHGEFEQLPHSHIKGGGCYECSGKKKHKQEDFLLKIQQIHMDKGTPDYDYSFVDYKNLDTKIKIICKKHGEFLITPRSILLQHAGCRQCGLDISGFNKRNTLEDFIIQANKIHNNKYDYTKTIYIKSNQNVIITCPIHGDFKQLPTNHLQSSECPTCGRLLIGGLGGYTQEYFKNNPDQQNIPAFLYAMNIINGNEKFIKIGITAKSIHHRYNRSEYKNMIIDTLYEKSMTLFEAFNTEQSLLEELKLYKFFSNSKFPGYTECLIYNPIVIDTLVETFHL